MLRFCAYPLLALSLGASVTQSPEVPISGSGSVYIRVTSIPRKYAPNLQSGRPIQFTAMALGEDLKKRADFINKTTPYILNLRGSDAYVMIRQESGEDMMYIEVRVSPRKSCEITARMSFVVVRGAECGGQYMPPDIKDRAAN